MPGLHIGTPTALLDRQTAGYDQRGSSFHVSDPSSPMMCYTIRRSSECLSILLSLSTVARQIGCCWQPWLCVACFSVSIPLHRLMPAMHIHYLLLFGLFGVYRCFTFYDDDDTQRDYRFARNDFFDAENA